MRCLVDFFYLLTHNLFIIFDIKINQITQQYLEYIKLMKELDYGKNYRYAHDEAGAYAAGEDYFPEGMPSVEWYTSGWN